MNRSELDAWIESYLDYLQDVRRINAKTIKDMRCTFGTMIPVMDEIRPGEPPWKLSFEDFLTWINKKRDEGMSERSISKQLSHIRGMLDYAWQSGRTDRNVLKGFTLKDSCRPEPPSFLSQEEARRLVNACRSTTKAERHDRVMILLLYGCGLRTSELCNLNVNDVDVERQEVFVRKGKGEIQRRIPVPGGVWTELLAYLAERGGKRGSLFRTQYKRRRLSISAVNDVVKGSARAAEIQNPVTAKTLRHSFATHLMDNGVDIAVIATLMGHRSPNETGVYLHVLKDKPRKAVRKLVQPKGEDDAEKK